MSDNHAAPSEPALILLSFPHQLLHALCALQQDRALRGLAADGPALLAIWSYQADDHQPSSRLREFFTTALRQYPFARVLVFDRQERDGPLSPYRRVKARARWLADRLGEEVMQSTFYYAHDASADHTAQAFMQALKPGRMICFGDAPGFLYPSTPPARPRLRLSPRSFKDWFWHTRLGGLERWRAAETALIAIDFKDQQPAAAYPRPVLIANHRLLRTLHALKAAFPQIEDFERQLLKAQRRPVLLILSNFTNSKLMSESNELALYLDICRTHLQAGELLYIKKHAGTDPTFVTQLLAALATWQPRQFPEHLEHLPVELFTGLHASSKVISVSSASALLSLLPDSRVIHALTSRHIDKLFFATQRHYMHTANERILHNTRPCQLT